MIDYLMDSTADLQISGGDFVKGNSNRQHQASLLKAEKGDYKQAPLATVGIASFLNDDNDGTSNSELLREIRLRFTADGINLLQLALNDGKILIVGDYGS